MSSILAAKLGGDKDIAKEQEDVERSDLEMRGVLKANLSQNQKAQPILDAK